MIVKEGIGLSKELDGVGGVVSPLACYPTTSDGRVAILCPLGEALRARLAEHPIVLGDAAIGVADLVTTGSLSTLLEGVAPLSVALGEVEQQGGTVPTDDLRVFDQQGGEALGVTDESLKAGGGDDGKHRSQVARG